MEMLNTCFVQRLPFPSLPSHDLVGHGEMDARTDDYLIRRVTFISGSPLLRLLANALHAFKHIFVSSSVVSLSLPPKRTGRRVIAAIIEAP